MSVITQSIALPDGRFVEVLLGGDPLGYPLVMHIEPLRTQPPSRTGTRPVRREAFD